MSMESLDFTQKPQERPRLSPEELAAKLKQMSEEEAAAKKAQEDLDFTAQAATAEDARAAEAILQKIQSLPGTTERVVPDDDDPWSKGGDQANRRNIH